MAITDSIQQIQQALDALDAAKQAAATPQPPVTPPPPVVPQPDERGEFASPADGAKYMASFGIPQVPLTPPTDTKFANPGKNPAINGKGWQNKASTDPAQIDAWAKQFPGCNFGSLAQARIGGFYSLETDSGDLAEKFSQETGSDLSANLIIRSSAANRHHRYYAQSEESLKELRNIGQDDAAGYSLRFDNEQCVSPGSIHQKTGVQYAVVFDNPPAAQPHEEIVWLKAQIKAKSAPPTAATTTPKEKYLIPPGGRHNALLKELSRLTEHGYSMESAEKALLLWAEENLELSNLSEPLQDHIHRMVYSSKDWERGNPAATVAYVGSSAVASSGPVVYDGGMMTVEQLKDAVHQLIYTSAETREEHNLPRSIKKATNEASTLVYEYLKKHGKFFNSEGVGYLLLEDGRLIKIAPDDVHLMNMLTEFGVFPAQEETVRFGKYIGMMAVTEGIKTTVRYTGHYNKETKCFYYADGNNLIKGDGKSLVRVPNGTDGELFKLDLGQPLLNLEELPVVERSLVPSGLMEEELFGDLVFKESALSRDGKCVLMTMYILLLILSGISKDRAALQIIGPTGCGKTTLFRKLGRAIIGPAFDVISLPEDVREFENILINNDLAFFDNVDSVHQKIKSLICQAVTGLMIKHREYFTTSKEVSIPSKATLGFSSLTPVLSTGELANRSVQITLKERVDGTNISENALMEQFERKRAALILEILVRANMVLRALEAQASYVPRVKGRLADFASIILKVARHEGWEPLALEILEAWDADQHDAALNNDDLSDALFKWMSSPDWKPGTFYAGELVDKLRRFVSGFSDTGASWKGQASLLAKILEKSQASYRRRFGMTIGEDKHTKTSTFTFNPPGPIVADAPVILTPDEPSTVEPVAVAEPTTVAAAGVSEDDLIEHPTLGLMPRWAVRKEERCS